MYRKYVKRVMDVICALAAIIVFSWLFIIVGVMVRIKLGKPVIFTQARPGKDEKIFKLYKFRTMTDKKDEEGNLLPDDQRITSFGRFLRKTSLDELPEAFNILKGDMSVVGPRPLLVEYLDRYNETQKHRHDVRPGLTGLAQISGRNLLDWDERFEKDIEYVRNVTFFGDVRIVFLTVWTAFFKREGISQKGQATMKKFSGSRETVAK